MKRSILLLPILLLSVQPGHACSPLEISQKTKAILEASKAAYEKDPGGNGQRKVRMKQ